MNHIALAAKALSEKLGCPVCEISAINKTGLPELKSAIKQLLLNPKSSSTKLIYQQDVGDALAAIRNSITDQSKTATFYSVKLVISPLSSSSRLPDIAHSWNLHMMMRWRVLSANSVIVGFNPFSVAGWLISLICDGVIFGVGIMVAFIPYLMMLFVFLAILEECGYMARVYVHYGPCIPPFRSFRKVLYSHAFGYLLYCSGNRCNPYDRKRK